MGQQQENANDTTATKLSMRKAMLTGCAPMYFATACLSGHIATRMKTHLKHRLSVVPQLWPRQEGDVALCNSVKQRRLTALLVLLSLVKLVKEEPPKAVQEQVQ